MSRSRTSRVKVEVIGDARGGQNALRAISGEAARTEKQFSALTAGVAAGFTSYAMPSVMRFARGFMSEARSLQESMGKTRAVFGESTDEILSFTNDSVSNLGLSRQAALDATATFGNLFDSMRIGTSLNKEMSTTLVGLAADMAAFNDVSPEAVLNAMVSGLTGATRPLKDLGVNLDEVTLKQRAFSLGLINDTTGVLPAHVRAIASYHEILAQTRNQQGTMARESDGNAAAQIRFKAAVEEAQAAIGTGLLPMLTGLYNAGTPIANMMANNADAVAAFAVSIGAVVAGRKIWDMVDGFAAFRTQTVEVARGMKQVEAALNAGRISYSDITVATNRYGREVLVATKQVGGFTTGLKSMAASIGPSLGVTAGLTLATWALTNAWTSAKKRAQDFKDDVEELSRLLLDQEGALTGVTNEWEEYIRERSRFADRNQIDDLFDLDRMNISMAELREITLGGVEGLNRFVASAEAAGEITEVFRSGTNDLVDATGKYIGTASEAVAINGKLYVGNVDLIKSVEREQEALEASALSKWEIAKSSDLLTDSLHAEIDAFLAASDSTQPHVEMLKVYGPTLKQLGIDLGVFASGLDESGDAAQTAADQIREMVAASEALARSLFGMDAISLSIDKAFEDFNRSMSGTGSTARRTASSVDLVAKKQEEVERATEAATRAQEAYERSLENIERAERRRADALSGVTDANRNYERSVRDVLEAQEALADAEAALAQALAGPSERDRLEAEFDLNEARRAQQKANEALERAENELGLARDAGEPVRIREAEMALEEAREKVMRATWRTEDAEKKLNDIRNWSAETDKKVKDAQDRVTEARERAEDAVRRVEKAERDKADAARAVTDAEKEVERATRDSTRAQGELEKAMAEAAATAARSPASFGSASGSLGDHSRSVYGTRDAYISLATSITNAVNSLLAMEATTAKTLIEFQRIGNAISANPFLTQDQKQNLYKYVSEMQRLKTGVPLFTPGYHPEWPMAEGGAGTVTKPTRFIAGEAGEPEDFWFVPHSQGGIPGALRRMSGGTTQITYEITVGSVRNDDDIRKLEDMLIRLQRMGSPAFN